MNPGTEIGLKVDQVLLQDATGTLVQLELEVMGLDRAKTEVAVCKLPLDRTTYFSKTSLELLFCFKGIHVSVSHVGKGAIVF